MTILFSKMTTKFSKSTKQINFKTGKLSQMWAVQIRALWQVLIHPDSSLHIRKCKVAFSWHPSGIILSKCFHLEIFFKISGTNIHIFKIFTGFVDLWINCLHVWKTNEIILFYTSQVQKAIAKTPAEFLSVDLHKPNLVSFSEDTCR